MNALSLWLPVLKICVVIVCALFLVRSGWKLTRYVSSSSAKTTKDRMHWLLYPWQHPPVRAVVVWLVLVIGAWLFLFLFPSPNYSEGKVPDGENPGIAKEMKNTVIPTEKQLQADRKKRAEATRKENFKDVDSPGIHYKPPKIDPEKNIDAILRRTQKRDNKEDK